ncbi:MAG TPA: hypothetical protein VF754_09650, partial [Pyrinomonadaceae bacterium]
MTSQRLAALLLLLIVLCSSHVLGAQKKGGDEVNLRRLGQAIEAIVGGNLAQAETLLNAVLASSPRDADAL